MRDSALESATSCENCEPPTSLDSLSRIPGITRDIRAYAKASQEFARIAQDQCAAESERETDKDLRQKLENEISEHQRRIKAIEHREREREEIMEQRSLEMGGLLAKLKAMLPA